MDSVKIIEISISDIYSDDSFNCRGSIAPMDVADLAKSIREIGLQFPIAVQPASDVKTTIPSRFQYRIIAGHRRFAAYKILATQEPERFGKISAMIRFGLDEVTARILNLSENLERRELSLLQEARAITALHEAGVPRDHVAKKLNKSSGWVQVRYYLLTLPEEIQMEAAAGVLNQYHIKQLYSLATPEEQFEAVRAIKTAKLNGEKVDHVGKRKKHKLTKAKQRVRTEMFDMIEVIAKALGYGLPTRVLAWTAGEITTEELFDDIRKENPEAVFPTEL